jgi:hypothetical protein
LLARLRQRHPEASDRELRERLARLQRAHEIAERIGERFPGVPQEEIEREAVKAVKEQCSVKLSGDVEGSYVIEETLADGRFVIAPDWPSKETSADAILERGGGRRMSPEEFDKHFADLCPRC